MVRLDAHKKLYFYKHQFVTVDRTLELYFQGCTIRCENCQNWALWEKDAGNLMHIDDILKQLIDYPSIAKCIHVLGGEPLNQDYEAMTMFLKKLKKMFPKTPICFFTGYDLKKEDVHDYYTFPQFKYVDIVKVGEYRENELNISKTIDPVLGIPLASLNQKGIKV